MTEFVEAGRLDQVPPGSGMSFTVAGKEVAVFNVDGGFCATQAMCTHRQGPLTEA